MARRVVYRAASLPSDHPWRKAEPNPDEATLAFPLSQELSSACSDLARHHEIDGFDVLAVGLRALLLRYEGYFGGAPSVTFGRLLEDSGFETVPPDSQNACFEVGLENGMGLRADVVLSLGESPRERVTGTWRYRRDLFDSETILRMDRHYRRLLEALVEDPERPVSEPCFLSETELQRLLVTWNDTRTPYPRDCSIPEIFAQVVCEHADHIAVIDGNEQLTYCELNARANALALHLAEQGVEAGSRVGLALERSISMVVSMLAILKAGGAYVPLDTSYPPERLRFMIADTDLSAIITDRNHEEQVCFGVRSVCVEDVAEAWKQAGPDFEPRATAESTAYIMYTSGSTGKPKGVEVPQRAVIRLVRNATYVDFSPSEVFAQISNSSFDAITFEVWGALLNGARLVIVPTEVVLSPDAFARAIQEHGLTAMFLTSSLFNLIAARCPTAFRTVRHLLVGGDAVDPRWSRHILETAPPARLINGYGPTECTTFSVTHQIREVAADAKSVPIGRPLSNSQAYILDRQMHPVPIGVPGELYLGGDGVAKGYWNRPELTAERFVLSPFDPAGKARLYKTGDVARYRSDGVIEYLGRTDHQVKIRGFRIELGEIETVLRQHPRVADCVVLVSEDASGGKSLLAYVATGQAPKPALEEIRRFLRERVPEFMVPSALMFVDQLPFSPNGKVDRQKLPAPDSERTAAGEKQQTPMTEAQQIIAAAWKKVVAGNSFGLDDNFFDVGGDSLRLAAVACELKSQFRAPFTITDLFEHPTIRTLAARLTDGRTEANLVSEAQERARRQKAAVSGLRTVVRGA